MSTEQTPVCPGVYFTASWCFFECFPNKALDMRGGGKAHISMAHKLLLCRGCLCCLNVVILLGVHSRADINGM